MLSQMDAIRNGKWKKPLSACITDHCKQSFCLLLLPQFFYFARVRCSDFQMRNMRKRHNMSKIKQRIQDMIPTQRREQRILTK